ncbi:MAG: YidH family protein [Candidatus Binataceae bacterium]
MNLAIERTSLARLRVQLALDRTTLAWIRTTLTMATFGFGTVAFFRSTMEESHTPAAIHLHQAAILFGVGLIVLGIVATVLAGISHWRTLRRLNRGQIPVLTQWPLTITIATLVAIIGLVAFGELAKFIGFTS